MSEPVIVIADDARFCCSSASIVGFDFAKAEKMTQRK